MSNSKPNDGTAPDRSLAPPKTSSGEALRELAREFREYADLVCDGIPFSVGRPTFEHWADVVEAAAPVSGEALRERLIALVRDLPRRSPTVLYERSGSPFCVTKPSAAMESDPQGEYVSLPAVTTLIPKIEALIREAAATVGSAPEQRACLECPCCGDDGAESDAEGLFYDGQKLICGCPGVVTVDEDDVWINNGDAPCQKCEQEAVGSAPPPDAECNCGSENPKSARHGHSHLAWCPVKWHRDGAVGSAPPPASTEEADQGLLGNTASGNQDEPTPRREDECES